MQRVQEEAAEKALKVMVSIPKLSSEWLLKSTCDLLKKLSEKEPIGKVKMSDLVTQGRKLEQTEIRKSDLADLDRFARKYAVGYTIFEKDDGTYNIFFRSERLEQMNACLNAMIRERFGEGYNKDNIRDQDLSWDKTEHSKEGIEEKLDRAQDTAAAMSAERQAERSVKDLGDRVLERGSR